MSTVYESVNLYLESEPLERLSAAISIRRDGRTGVLVSLFRKLAYLGGATPFT